MIDIAVASTSVAELAARLVRRGLGISAGAFIGLAGVYVLALGYTPVEAQLGLVQKIFYLHVPAAWTAMLAFVLVGVVSALYFWLQDPRLDRFAGASAEVGVVFGVVMLTTGPIWGRSSWGAWWSWDARLTFTLLLFFVFVGYLALRSALHDPAERARFSAVVGILGMLLVPFVHVSVYRYRTLHPRPVVANPTGAQLPGTMLRTLLISLAVFTVLYIGFVVTRYGVALRDEAREAADVG